jgi:hypothetical protein
LSDPAAVGVSMWSGMRNATEWAIPGLHDNKVFAAPIGALFSAGWALGDDASSPFSNVFQFGQVEAHG